MKEKKTDCRKIQYKKVTFEHKLFVIGQITNGKISVNYASKKYDISRSSLNYWTKKYATLDQKIKSMSKDKTIANLEIITGTNFLKKYLSKTLAKEITKKKANLLK